MKIPPKNCVELRCSPKMMNANKMTNGLYTVSTIAEMPAPKILSEWRKIMSAIPIPIIPLMDNRSKSVFENWGLGNNGIPIIMKVSKNSNRPMVFFIGFIIIGETRSPIFLNIIIANAQKMAESNEHISPMYEISVNIASKMR